MKASILTPVKSGSLLKQAQCFKTAISSALYSAKVTSATFQTHPYKLFKLDSGPKSEVELTAEKARFYYKEMQIIRRMEAVAAQLYKEHKVRGFCHLYIGQEACAVGSVAALDKNDALVTSYRCHGWSYAMGASVSDILSEMTGVIGGNVHGKGGSMHMFMHNFYGCNGIVGAQQSLGAGVAFAIKYKKQPNMCLAVYGDGAANQGQLFEAFNMAKLWNLPCVFVCENNGYAMSTTAPRSSASTDYYTRGDYVPGIWVDGMDVLTVREAVRFAGEYCAAGNGPLVLEFSTYRYLGHSMVDSGTRYRSAIEVHKVKHERDPITHFRDKIITAKLISEEEVKVIDKEVWKEVDEARKVAATDQVLPPEALYTDIYINTPPVKIRGTTAVDTVVQPFLTTDELIQRLGRAPAKQA